MNKSLTYECIEENENTNDRFENKQNRKCAVCLYTIKPEDESVYPEITEHGVKYFAVFSHTLNDFVCDPCIPFVPKPAKCRGCDEQFQSKGALFKHLRTNPSHNVCRM